MAKNNTLIQYTNKKDTIPASSAGTGTIQPFPTTGGTRVVGTGTLFESEAEEGDWLYIPGTNEVHKIDTIASNTELYLLDGFAAPVVASSYRIVPASIYRMVSFLVTGANAAIIDGISFAQDQGNTFEKQTKGDQSSGDYIDPIVIDANTNSTTVLITVRF